MAAFAVENSNLVWQRVKARLSGGPVATQASPAARLAFRALREWLATHKPNVDLQFLSFTGTQSVAAGGTVLATGTATVYGVYVRKTGTVGAGNTTPVAIKFYDDATNDGTAGDGILGLGLLTTGDESCQIYTPGITLATGLVVTGHVNMAATTDSAAGDGGPGFVIVGQ